MGNGSNLGSPCKDCTAHSGVIIGAGDAQNELSCLRRRFDDLDEEIGAVDKSKISVKIFIWIVGSILSSMVIVSGFLWDGIKSAEIYNMGFHKEFGDKMTDISVDLRVIKRELENK